jgi:methyl-accepting chemotaxis protein
MLQELKKKFRFTVTWKLAVILVIALTAFNVYNYAVAIPVIQGRLESEMHTRVQSEVQTVCGTLQYYYAMESSGTFTRSEAQQHALTAISDLSYGADGEGYFWVTDYQPVLLADSSMPSRIGTDVGTLADANGRRLFAEMSDICRTGGEGFYNYRWGNGSSNQASSKVAYVKSFEPWGWSVGTAVDVGSLSGLGAANKWTLGFVGGLVACLMVVVFIVVVRFVVIKPLASMVKTSKALVEGDVDQKINVRSNDEIGDLGLAYSGVVDYVQEIAGITKRIADGDLAVEIKPRSEKDVLSNSIAHMVANQRQLIGRVKSTAASVAEASKQLSNASEQTARATQQIASTIQQIARGAAEQATSLQETTNGVEQLSCAIDQIAKGAQEQARDVEGASATIKKVSVAIDNVSMNAKAGDEEWGSTAASAAEGARKAHETVVGMNKIKKAIEVVSVKVSDLGERSEEIGKIVATIDDIAAQTNLLALNAAIEAARAGEQGRGFAVVADEVRKLAERSSVATKEIAELVGGIQTRVREAVGAMHEGGKDIEMGYKLAADAGVALDDILGRSGKVGRQVEQISRATRELQQLSAGMVEAIDRINRIVEQNAAATEEMMASSGAVSKAVESTAGVAEENSAASEEVSASVEEMSAHVEEVLAAAQSLTDTADELERSMAIFKTDEGAATDKAAIGKVECPR